MPTARELLEQADALMRRNRKRGRDKGEGPPTLTDVLADRNAALAPTIILPDAARSNVDPIQVANADGADPLALDTLSDLPVLTDVVDVWPSSEAPRASVPNAVASPLGLDEALEADALGNTAVAVEDAPAGGRTPVSHATHAVRGKTDAADMEVADTDGAGAHHSAAAISTAATADAREGSRVVADASRTVVAEADATSTVVATADETSTVGGDSDKTTAVVGDAHETSTVGGDSDETSPGVGDAHALSTVVSAADETSMVAGDAHVTSVADADEESTIVRDEDRAVGALSSPGGVEPRAKPFAPPLDEEFILDIPPSGARDALPSVRESEAAPYLHPQASPVILPGSPDWNAMAEEIRMQVLQRLDLFTDTGMRDQLGARLQPIVNRASAELVETINRELGELVRGYVAEAIEREIESWRNRGDS
ncbi:MAG TPA: hypothetical protein VLI21_03220 [Casimicrobiaceae bacterium]|nr:hypothetical protein [Casimicrobiaceae bacterium]